VGEVQNALIVGVGVDGGHEATHDAKVVMQHLGHGGQAVGSAGSVGNDLVFRFELQVVDTHHDGGVHLIFGRSGEDHLVGASSEVFGGLFLAGKDAGGFHHDFHAEVFPGQDFRVFFGKDADFAAVDDDAVVGVGNFAVEDLVDAVILKEVGQGLGVREVVDGHHVDIRMVFDDGAQDEASDASKAVNRYIDHYLSPYIRMLLLALPVTRQKPSTVFCIFSSPLASHLRGSNLDLLGT